MPPVQPATSPALATVSGHVPAAGAAVAQQQGVGFTPYAGAISGVLFAPEAAVAGVVTNNRTLRLINRGEDGTGTDVVATLTLGAGANIAKHETRSLPTTEANIYVAQGDLLVWDEVVNGTGLASPGGTVLVLVSRGVTEGV